MSSLNSIIKIRELRGEVEDLNLNVNEWRAAYIRAVDTAVLWQEALVSLTPGGSEFVDDPAYCVKVIKEFQQGQHDQIIKLAKEVIGWRS